MVWSGLTAALQGGITLEFVNMYVPGFDSIVDLEQISTKDLVEVLFQARGEQRVAWLRTKLNQRLERRSGRRGLGGARDKVLTNGSLRAYLNGA